MYLYISVILLIQHAAHFIDSLNRLLLLSLQACSNGACACVDSEKCVCAAISAYVHACAAAGVLLKGWRNTVCGRLNPSNVNSSPNLFRIFRH